MTEARLPAREIRTDRLVLRAVELSDADEQVEAIAASLAELRPWMPWAQHPQTRAEAEANLREGIAGWDDAEQCNWTIRDAQTEEFVGRVSLFRVDLSVPKGEIGYWLTSARAGRGLAREATRAVVDAALALGFRRVEIRCDSRNERSARIPDALGFTRDALLRHDAVSASDPAVLRDTLVYSVVR